MHLHPGRLCLAVCPGRHVSFGYKGRPAALGLYGYVQYFCWFNTGQATTFWLKMGFFFIPLWVFFILNLSLSVKTYLSLKKI